MTFPNSEQAEAMRIALDMACKEFGLREADEASRTRVSSAITALAPGRSGRRGASEYLRGSPVSFSGLKAENRRRISSAVANGNTLGLMLHRRLTQAATFRD